MRTRIDQAAKKVIKMNQELVELKQRYSIAINSRNTTLESLKLLTNRAAEAAKRAGTTAEESLIAATEVENTKINPKGKRLLTSTEEAEIAADRANKFAKEAVDLAHEVLLTARTVAANEKDVTAIQTSMNSVLIALRSAEAAIAAAKLAQSGTALAGFLALTSL